MRSSRSAAASAKPTPDVDGQRGRACGVAPDANRRHQCRLREQKPDRDACEAQTGTRRSPLAVTSSVQRHGRAGSRAGRNSGSIVPGQERAERRSKWPRKTDWIWMRSAADWLGNSRRRPVLTWRQDRGDGEVRTLNAGQRRSCHSERSEKPATRASHEVEGPLGPA